MKGGFFFCEESGGWEIVPLCKWLWQLLTQESACSEASLEASRATCHTDVRLKNSISAQEAQGGTQTHKSAPAIDTPTNELAGAFGYEDKYGEGKDKDDGRL